MGILATPGSGGNDSRPGEGSRGGRWGALLAACRRLARPIEHALQHLVAGRLDPAILEGRFQDGDTIRVSADGPGLVFEKAA